MKPTVLILDDEERIREDLLKHLRNNGYEVFASQKLKNFNEIIQSKNIDYAIIDLKIDQSSEYGGIKAIENIININREEESNG